MMTIGISDDHTNEGKYRLYVDWLRAAGADVECVRLSRRENNAGALARCDGLVLSGGGDVQPGLYGGPADHPTLSGVQPERDVFESGLVAQAFEREMPLLGICRGMQLVNVLLGGTLIVDLEEAGFRSHRSGAGRQCLHAVRVGTGSFFRDCLSAETGTVASSHHQAVDRTGRTLRIAGVSDDGVVEALERVTDDGKITALLVQWHPERMGWPVPALSSGVRDCYFEILRTHMTSINEKG